MPELAFRVEIEWTPEGAIDDNDEEAHHRDAEHDAVKIAGLGLLGNIGAESVGAQMLVAPGCDLGDDAGIPRAARGGDRAGDVIGQHRGQRDAPPPQPAAHAEIGAGGAQLGRNRRGAGDDIEQNVPLGAEDHQRAQPDIRVELERDDRRDRDREQKIGRKGGEKLRHRLDEIGDLRPRADPNADRHPDDAGERDQHDDPAERGESEQKGRQPRRTA